jgi:uncharacterized OB-fold protein
MSEGKQHPELNKEFTHAAYHRLLKEKKLMCSQCESCGTLHLPPRPLCTACYSDDMQWVALSGQGKLLAFTTVHIAPSAMIEAGYGRDNPYCTGIVQLQEGPAISAQILGVDATHPEQIVIGTPLQATFVERDEADGKQTYLAFTVHSG